MTQSNQELFKEQLRKVIKNFNINRAEKLSIEIHNKESIGYTITCEENKLWSILTNMIQKEYIKEGAKFIWQKK